MTALYHHIRLFGQIAALAALCALPIWLSQIDQQRRAANHIAFTITETDR